MLEAEFGVPQSFSAGEVPRLKELPDAFLSLHLICSKYNMQKHKSENICRRTVIGIFLFT